LQPDEHSRAEQQRAEDQRLVEVAGTWLGAGGPGADRDRSVIDQELRQAP
jgi:hypothetical protein